MPNSIDLEVLQALNEKLEHLKATIVYLSDELEELKQVKPKPLNMRIKDVVLLYINGIVTQDEVRDMCRLPTQEEVRKRITDGR